MTARDRWVEMYQDVQGDWRWRLVAGNGETIADSGEGYVHYRDARVMAEELHPHLEIRQPEGDADGD
jgi:uncharacterized protein YegP (UPF0339 family)